MKKFEDYYNAIYKLITEAKDDMADQISSCGLEDVSDVTSVSNFSQFTKSDCGSDISFLEDTKDDEISDFKIEKQNKGLYDYSLKRSFDRDEESKRVQFDDSEHEDIPKKGLIKKEINNQQLSVLPCRNQIDGK